VKNESINPVDNQAARIIFFIKKKIKKYNTIA